MPRDVYRLDKEEDPRSILEPWMERTVLRPVSGPCRAQADAIEASLRKKKRVDGEYVALTWTEMAYLALCSSEIPLTPAEVTELCAEVGWVPTTIPEQAERSIAEAMEGAGSPASPFVPCEGCLAGSFSLRHLTLHHLRNAVVPRAYQLLGMTLFPNSAIPYIPRTHEHKWFEVRPSTIPGAGMGLFVRRGLECIPQGTVIAEYQGTLHPLTTKHRDHHYPYGIVVDLLAGDHLLNALDRRGRLRCYAPLANDAGPLHRNAYLTEFTELPGVFLQVARDVLGGEEILLQYGAAYWGLDAYPDLGPIADWAALPKALSPAAQAVSGPGDDATASSSSHSSDCQSIKAEKDDDTESIAGPLDPPCETCPMCHLEIPFHAVDLHYKSCGAGVGRVAPEAHERNWWSTLEGRRRRLPPQPQYQCEYCGRYFETASQRAAHPCQRRAPCPVCGTEVDARDTDRHRRRCRPPRNRGVPQAAPTEDPTARAVPKEKAGSPQPAEQTRSHSKTPATRGAPPAAGPAVVRVGPITIPPQYHHLVVPRTQSPTAPPASSSSIAASRRAPNVAPSHPPSHRRLLVARRMGPFHTDGIEEPPTAAKRLLTTPRSPSAREESPPRGWGRPRLPRLVGDTDAADPASIPSTAIGSPTCLPDHLDPMEPKGSALTDTHPLPSDLPQPSPSASLSPSSGDTIARVPGDPTE